VIVQGTIAEFEDPHLFVNAAARLRELRYSRIGAISPYALPDLDVALGIPRTKLRWWVLVAGLTGVVLAYAVQRWCNAVDYPYLVGGRPFDSIPTEIPIMFETGILLAGTTAFVAMLVASRMPRLWSPVLDVPGYERTSVDRCWLVVDETDPAWSVGLLDELAQLGAVEIRRLPMEDGT
jgi:hypothetical protein